MLVPSLSNPATLPIVLATSVRAHHARTQSWWHVHTFSFSFGRMWQADKEVDDQRKHTGSGRPSMLCGCWLEPNERQTPQCSQSVRVSQTALAQPGLPKVSLSTCISKNYEIDLKKKHIRIIFGEKLRIKRTENLVLKRLKKRHFWHHWPQLKLCTGTDLHRDTA